MCMQQQASNDFWRSERSVSRCETGEVGEIINLSDTDDTGVWQAIDWKGEYSVSVPSRKVTPSDDEFKAHFEKILNHGYERDMPQDEIWSEVSIPLLDDPISKPTVPGVRT